MTKKITKERLLEIVEHVQEETRKNLQEDIENAIGPGQEITLQEFVDEKLLPVLGVVFANATSHAEYLIEDVLRELELLIETDDE